MQLENVVECTNYLNSDLVTNFYPYLSTLDGTLSQIIDTRSLMASNDDGAMRDFVAETIIEIFENDKNDKSFCSQIKP